MQTDRTRRLSLYLDDAEAVDALFRQALQAQGEAAFSEFLNFLAKFSRYSLFNTLLIRVQRPGAVAVASRQRWREHGRMVAPDAIPIVILQPFGPVQFVYDLGDTDKPVLDLFNNFNPEGRVPVDAWEKVKAGAAKYGITVELTENYGSALAGTATILDKTANSDLTSGSGSARYRVRVNRQLKQGGRFAVLAHELAHIYCGHLGGDPRNRWVDRSGQLTVGQRELEAEAVSWLICRRLGIETRSAEYLADYVRDGDLDKISTFAITSAAHRIETWRHAN